MSTNISYNASLTREPFLFYEMRTAARLLATGISAAEAVEQIVQENLFQYPTEKLIKRMAMACVRRLAGMGDEGLIAAIAQQPMDVAKQICLYAMMKDSRLVWEFMVTVVGEKFRVKELSYGKMDVNAFFLRLQEQDDGVASWSDSTISKLKQILTRVLVENEYLDSITADHINPVWLHPILENAIRSNNDDVILPAFNCFS